MLPKYINSKAIQPVVLSIGMLTMLVLTGCASRPQVPTASATVATTPLAQVPSSYTVRPGDTLSNVANRYGLDYLVVARMNNIAPPYIIYINQNLKLKANSATVSTVQQSVTANNRPVQQATPPIQRQSIPLPTTQSTTIKTTAQTSITPPPQVAPSVSTNTQGRWLKPTTNAILQSYNPASNVKGIRYSGQINDPVYAVADGQVVYANSGLKEFGNLILIKHANGYISAYAHNNKLLVQSGSRVKAGQQIAQMGSTGTNQVMLELQIRANGKAINPAEIIPIN